MNYEKHKLPAGLVGILSLFFITFFRYASPSSSMIVGSILFAFCAVILIVQIIGYKHIKSKTHLAGAICLFIVVAVGVISNYYTIHKINDHYLILVMPILLMVFIQVADKIYIPHLKDEKRIKKEKVGTTFSMILLLILEVIAIYGVFVLKK
jgi:predicted neutral ceramidase superfamily lipid hydrolase